MINPISHRVMNHKEKILIGTHANTHTHATVHTVYVTYTYICTPNYIILHSCTCECVKERDRQTEMKGDIRKLITVVAEKRLKS